MGSRFAFGVLAAVTVLLSTACAGPAAVADATVCGSRPLRVATPHLSLDLVFACAPGTKDNVEETRLYRLTSEGSRLLVGGPAPAGDPAVASTAGRMAFDSTRGGSPGIYVADLAGGGVRQVAGKPGGQSDPAWSPDGKELVYVSGQDGLHAPVGPSDMYGGLFVVGLDGSGARPLTDGSAYAGQPSWAPKGNRIAYATDAGGRWRLATIGTDGQDPRLFMDTDGATWPSWSPDGKQISFERSMSPDGSGDEAIWVVGADGAGARQLTWGEQPSWSPDGRWIAFVRPGADGTSNLWVIRSGGGSALRLTDDGGLKERPAWTA